MTVEGRIFVPVVDHDKCDACSICFDACPAGKIPELQKEPETVRGKIYRKFGEQIKPAVEQQSVLPPCRLNCPIDQDVSGYLSLIAQERFEEALTLIRETNPLPSVCGYVCHRPCETACTRGAVDGSLSIRSMKKFVTDLVADSYQPPIADKSGHKIAVIGSGPAGLTAAHDLAVVGHQVEVYESYSEPGGMLVWAIPEFRLPRNAIKRDIDTLRKLGVVFYTNQSFSQDFNASDLQEKGVEAIIIATGTMKSVGLGLESTSHETDVFDCLSFLQRYNSRDKVELGKTVLVIGGGNAALDSARAAVRLSAEDVTIVYRRSQREMPADQAEIEDALKDGIKIIYQTMPVKLKINRGKVVGLDCVKTELVDDHRSHRKKPIPVADSDFYLEAETIISAVGQKSDHSSIAPGFSDDFKAEQLSVSDEKTMVKGAKGAFVAGDFINGATTVVDAMASGRKAAQTVNQYLKK